MEIDPQVEKEINKMKSEMVGPDGQIEEIKLPVAMQMSRYPSMESVDPDFWKPSLTRSEQRKYEEKEKTIDAKLEIVQVVLTEKLVMAKTDAQVRLFRAKYASICDEFNRQKWICQDILARADFTPSDYPEPFKVKTPPNRNLTMEEIDYYIEMEEKFKKWDEWAQKAYLDWLKDIETSEERRQCYKSQERYVAWSHATQAKIRYAFQPKRSPERRTENGQRKDKEQENEYLDLEQPEDVPNIHQISQKELDLVFGTGISPTSSIPSPQKAMDERISELSKKSKETTPSSDKVEERREELSPKEKPLPQREKI